MKVNKLFSLPNLIAAKSYESTNLNPSLSALIKHLRLLTRTGGVVSIVPGFGLGQKIQHRWKPDGFQFTAMESGILGLGVATVLFTDECESRAHQFKKLTKKTAWCQNRKDRHIFFDSLGYIFIAIKVWELGDAWFMPRFLEKSGRWQVSLVNNPDNVHAPGIALTGVLSTSKK